MGFLGKLIGTVRILQGALGMPATRLVVAPFVVFGSGPMGVGRKLVLFGGSTMGFVHGWSFLRREDRQTSLWRPGTGSRAVPWIRKLQLLAMRRLRAQRVPEFLSGGRSLEVAGQDLTIRGFAAVEFTVGVVIRAKRGAFERNARKQPA
jgi:hypothetical protein